jgi:hypothetical protein
MPAFLTTNRQELTANEREVTRIKALNYKRKKIKNVFVTRGDYTDFIWILDAADELTGPFFVSIPTFLSRPSLHLRESAFICG